MAVSATAEPTAEKSFVHNLDEDLAASPAFHAVFFAEKRLHFAEAAAGGAATLAKILALAKVGSSRTLVFVEEPENAAEIAAKLAAACSPDRVALMTGTMRGLERDRLTRSEVFRIFTEHVPPPEPCFFVATSAAEVGINITSERLVTVAVESDRLLQRLGRLNRFGGAPAEAIVVTDPKTRNLPRIAETLAYLHALPALSDGARDVSCAALRRAGPPPPESRTELPAFARFDARLLDLWAQTSVASPVIPDVEPWLHGLQKSIPETEVAWREEVERLATAAVDERSREDAFNRYRVLPHERLKEPTYRLQEKLEAIAAKSPDTAVLFRTRDGSVIYSTLSVVCRWKVPQLNHGLLLLPPGCGGLTAHGMFTTDASAEGVPYDVADEDVGGTAARNAHRCRYLVEGGQWRRLGSDSPDPDPPSSLNAATLAAYARERGFGAPIKVEIQDGSDTGEESSYLVFFPERQQTYPPSPRILLREHLDHAAECSRQIAVSAGCDHLAESFRQAGLWHDEGKRHHLWQKAMGGSTTEPLAKTPAPAAPRLLNGFRHELASLKSTLEQATLDDLALHLVASHHGWARPHWTTRAYDRDALGSSEIAALEAARRFARLQQLWEGTGVWPTSKRCSKRPMRCRSRRAAAMPDLTVPLDPLNPGQFLACCGLLESLSWANPNILAFFEASESTPRFARFHVQGATPKDLARTLHALKHAVAEGEGDQKDGIRPMRLSTETGPEIILDWWLNEFRIETTDLKCWAGQVTTAKLFADLLPLLDPDTSANGIFTQSALTKSKFGIDPRSAWNALDLGFSPDAHNRDAATYPAVEILGAIGLQSIRLNVERRTAAYFLWTTALPLAIVRLAAGDAWEGLPHYGYRFAISKRGQSYKYFEFAELIERNASYGNI